MNSNISKYVSMSSYVLMGISALATILFYTGIITESLFLIWAYFLFFIAVASTLVFSFMRIFSSAKSAKQGLMSLGILVILVFIAWLIASPEIPQFLGVEEFNVTPAISRNVGTVLVITYILFIVAIGSMLYYAVKNMFS